SEPRRRRPRHRRDLGRLPGIRRERAGAAQHRQGFLTVAGGAVRGFAAGALGLIALQTLTSDQYAGKAAGLIGTITGLVARALDPDVPAIPDHSAATPADAAANAGAKDMGNPYANPTSTDHGRVPIAGHPRPT